ncbi:hypothetical protein ZIOFF_043902 [Zingiber officinale]|uniref:Uncharacterized protein n=2 Tax=Zingiber officinale TaxID=94328 RepID=A0A8J5G514_ZINOF|nr:hypothetical protein ZIOFF_043902 [Zingiber officinale]
MALRPFPLAGIECRRNPPFSVSSSASASASASCCSKLRCKMPSTIVDGGDLEQKGEIRLRLAALSLHPLPVDAASDDFPSHRSSLSAAVGPPVHSPIFQWNLDRRHILLLNFTVCAAAVSAAWIFFSAIPTLLAFRKAAESIEKLLDVTTEELPDTMAAVRLSGMEISDLTTELSDLGQELTQGVKNSTRAVRVAEDRLRRLTTMNPAVTMQGKTPQSDQTVEPAVARTARNMREGIVNGRVAFGLIFSLTQVSRWAFNFLTSDAGKKSSNKQSLNIPLGPAVADSQLTYVSTTINFHKTSRQKTVLLHSCIKDRYVFGTGACEVHRSASGAIGSTAGGGGDDNALLRQRTPKKREIASAGAWRTGGG